MNTQAPVESRLAKQNGGSHGILFLHFSKCMRWFSDTAVYFQSARKA